MATTVHEQPKLKPSREPGKWQPDLGGGGRIPVPADGPMRSLKDFSEPPASTAMWVLIAAIVMSFAAFTSALVVRQGGALDWRHLTLPPILFLNTVVILLSSVSLEITRRQIGIRMSARSVRAGKPALWLGATAFLGSLFIAGQYAAWLQLRAQGLYMSTSPNSSFFYLFTVLHALHVLGGMIGLLYVGVKLERMTLRRSTLTAMCRYWHFIGILWLYLLYILWARI